MLLYVDHLDGPESSTLAMNGGAAPRCVFGAGCKQIRVTKRVSDTKAELYKAVL